MIGDEKECARFFSIDFVLVCSFDICIIIDFFALFLTDT